MCLDNLEIEVLQQGVSFVRSWQPQWFRLEVVVSTRNLVTVCCFVSFSFYLKLSFWLNMNAFVCFIMMCE